MGKTELIWIIAYILVIGIAGGLWVFWHRRAELTFLKRLILQLRRQHKVRAPLTISPVPYRYLPLYLQLQQLLDHLPPPLGRDKLTGLINRVGLKSTLTHMMPVTQGTFVLVDIYRFRYVNDLFGFGFGDELLLAWSKRLKSLISATELLARMNEDEFLIYYKQPQGEAQLSVLQYQLQQPINIRGTVINLQVQLGYLDLARHHSDVSQMLRRLDLAMVRAKSSSNLIASYREGDDISQHRQLTIISSFPGALKNNELYLVYQPKYDLSNGRCAHAEALIRWDSPELGRISPGEFIPLLECAGMIRMLSQWVIENVLKQQQRWQSSDMVMQVAVNLAIDDLSSKRLTELILGLLKHYGLSVDILAIEVTESQLMTDMSRTVSVLNQLKRSGINVAIDDFGTGHSSLAYLKHLPIDEVKIDKTFLTQIESDHRGQHILSSAIELAKGLGFSVTIEGVETEQVFSLLVDMGVDKVQGDLIAKPMTAAELEMNWGSINRPIVTHQSA
ncbi:phosphodiesterase [Shewanella sp. AS1]|uniref:putative bifunctional diguanylate cyclase/phosphodiesterase n=1 Tax=Shewanella sp. AS1 TaxID=2907626 RepID=UPI001F263502|nr:phosphodiesterase [Shewanella sp. AS1]MCE9679127.1 phosphodiesterase [Shewanella sp. AS1]